MGIECSVKEVQQQITCAYVNMDHPAGKGECIINKGQAWRESAPIRKKKKERRMEREIVTG